MQKNILITGGTGLIGAHLTPLLLKKGYKVNYLSRGKKNIPDVKVYQWDIDKQFIDEEAITNADIIIHLAGSNVGEGRWTEKKKKEILESRTLSTTLIAQKLNEYNKKLDVFISASGIGIYGADTGDQLITENSPIGNDFIAQVTQAWEKSSEPIEKMGIRTVKLRTGVVLTKDEGALGKLTKPIQLGFGAALASGKQYISWVHIQDICHMYLSSIENISMQGTYNAVSSQPVTNEEFTKKIAEILHKSIWLPNVPSFVLYLLVGEMASLVIGGNKVANEKIVASGFQENFPDISLALEDIFNSSK